ncbi:unnamed protein product [Clavelina lepadiformis]|uniref:Uncharacterized protein n=1 Tax=Clavelina lepadiformis TaxID=159417 RepID=A0ABP0G478_CLALP
MVLQNVLGTKRSRCGISSLGRWSLPPALGCIPKQPDSEKTPSTGASVRFDNDPSAGSPTETLLRLLLPLNDQARSSFRTPVRPLPAAPGPIGVSH